MLAVAAGTTNTGDTLSSHGKLIKKLLVAVGAFVNPFIISLYCPATVVSAALTHAPVPGLNLCNVAVNVAPPDTCANVWLFPAVVLNDICAGAAANDVKIAAGVLAVLAAIVAGNVGQVTPVTDCPTRKLADTRSSTVVVARK
jgi:hypothetical protein